MRLADDAGVEHVAEPPDLAAACVWVRACDGVDRAVVLAQSDGAVRLTVRVDRDLGRGEIPELVLDAGEERDTFGQRRIGKAFGRHPVAHRCGQESAAGTEDVVQQRTAPDSIDRLQESFRQAVVRRRERRLRVRRDFVEVPRPPDTVPDDLAFDEAGRLERAKLLEDGGAADAHPPDELVGR